MDLTKDSSVTLTYVSTKLGYIDKTQDGIIYHESKPESVEITGYIIEHDHWGNWKYIING